MSDHQQSDPRAPRLAPFIWILLLSFSGCTALVGIEEGKLALCPDGTRIEEGGCAPSSGTGSGDGSGGGGGSGSGSGGSAGCAPPWQHEDSGQCYFMESTSRDWTASRQRCLDLGGDLAAIGSAEELAFLGEWVTDNVWIGGSDAAAEGTYTWSNGEPWVFSSWLDGSPNDPGGNRDCVALAISNGALPSFQARQCGDKRAVLCESLPSGP